MAANGGANTLPDYVFEPGYSLMSLEDLQAFVWENKHLPAMSKAPEGLRGKIDLAGHQMGILEELETAHVYIEQLNSDNPSVRGVRLRANFGKAMALAAGFERARADKVVMMDADLQDDPADLPKVLAELDNGLDVVVGWKVNRLDPANRKIFSKIFNTTVAYVTGVHLHDMNCGFKAYRREVRSDLVLPPRQRMGREQRAPRE